MRLTSISRTFLVDRTLCSSVFFAMVLAVLVNCNHALADGERDDPGLGAAGAKPRISQFTAELYGGYVIVTGVVTDADADPDGWAVSIWGTVSGTAYVRSDGTFTAYFPQAGSYGTVYSRTSDGDGHFSNIAISEIYD